MCVSSSVPPSLSLSQPHSRPLPAGWRKGYCDSRVFFVNTETGTTTWNLDEVLAATATDKVITFHSSNKGLEPVWCNPSKLWVRLSYSTLAPSPYGYRIVFRMQPKFDLKKVKVLLLEGCPIRRLSW